MGSLTLVSEAAAIGLHSCILLAKNPEEALSARRIAERLGVSYDHTVQILQRLRKGGILTSTQGPQGGFRLRCNPFETTLLTVYEILDGRLIDRRCLFQHEQCTEACSLFGGLVGGVGGNVRLFLTEHTLAMLAELS